MVQWQPVVHIAQPFHLSAHSSSARQLWLVTRLPGRLRSPRLAARLPSWTCVWLTASESMAHMPGGAGGAA